MKNPKSLNKIKKMNESKSSKNVKEITLDKEGITLSRKEFEKDEQDAEDLANEGDTFKLFM